jgi:hypothetical protein
MRNFTSLISFIFVLLVGNLSFALAQDFQIGQSIILEAKKPVGVPLHRGPSPSYLKHVPGGSTAVIQHISQEGPWLHILLASGETHWIHRKYVRVSTAVPTPPVSTTTSPLEAPEEPKTTMASEHEVWTSKEQCQAAVQKGLRMVEASSSTLRVATWNVRWFPLGSAPDRPQKSAEPTDIDWLISTIREIEYIQSTIVSDGS